MNLHQSIVIHVLALQFFAQGVCNYQTGNECKFVTALILVQFLAC